MPPTFVKENIWLSMFLVLLSGTQSFNSLYSVSFSFLFFKQNVSRRKTVNIKLLSANSFIARQYMQGYWPGLLAYPFPAPTPTAHPKNNASVNQNIEVDMTESVIKFSRCDKIDLPIKKSQLRHRRNYFNLF